MDGTTASASTWDTSRATARRVARAAVRLPFPDFLATMGNALLAVGVEVAVRVVPLRRLAPLFGLSLTFDAADPPEGRPPSPPFDPSERRQLKAVLRVMRHWPFGRGSCLRQSLLVGLHLRRRRPRLRLGLRRSRSGSIDAHAWVEVSGTLIGGDRSFVALAEDGGRSRQVPHSL